MTRDRAMVLYGVLFGCGCFAGWNAKPTDIPSPKPSLKADAGQNASAAPPFTSVRVYCTGTNALITNDGRPTRFRRKTSDGVESGRIELDHGWAYSFTTGTTEVRHESFTVECEATR